LEGGRPVLVLKEVDDPLPALRCLALAAAKLDEKLMEAICDMPVAIRPVSAG
jgi:hypothetical protein